MQQLVPLYLPCYRVSQANRRLYGISCDEAQSCRDRKQRWEQKAQEVDGERGWSDLKGSRSMLRWVGEGKVGQNRKCRGESISMEQLLALLKPQSLPLHTRAGGRSEVPPSIAPSGREHCRNHPVLPKRTCCAGCKQGKSWALPENKQKPTPK